MLSLQFIYLIYMNLIFIILLAIGLAMDCFTVSITCGVVQNNIKTSQRLLMAFLFGFFQAAMPLIGWLAGVSFAKYIEPVDHWLAFIILLFIGGKMIVENLKNKQDDLSKEFNSQYFTFKRLMILSIATSIDALATGLIFIGQDNEIWWVIAIIGLVSFVFSIAGSFIGSYCRNRFTFNKWELLGGIILIAIGTKILIEHLFF